MPSSSTLPGMIFRSGKTLILPSLTWGAGVEWNNWEIGIHVENLFDEDYYIDVQEFPNFAGSALPSGQGAIIIGTLEQPRRGCRFGAVPFLGI